MSNLKHREIATKKPTLLDADKGIVAFTATTATIDSCYEVVKPDGADFSRFQKNAPLLDSHDSSSVENIIGRVNNWHLDDDALVLTVQFAIDVKENVRAQTAFAMVKGSYVRACSIGFIPIQTAYPSDPDWMASCAELGLEDSAHAIRCIYQKWLLLELSICCIGANPDAVARSAGQKTTAQKPGTLSEFFGR